MRRSVCWIYRGAAPALVVVLALAAVLAIAPAHGANGGERPFTVDDLLKLSDVGGAVARPGSDTFVWEQSPPYDSLTDFGAGVTGTWQGSDYEIFVAGPEAKAPRQLFQPRRGTTYRLGGFSRDGRFLTLLALRDGQVKLSAYDFRRHRLKEFALAPRFSPLEPEPDWVWVDNRRLAVAVYPAGQGPWQLTFRRGIARHLIDSWAKSWRGKEVSVDQYDSSADDAIHPLPGRLIVIDLVSGQIQQLASGQYAGLRSSPDGRWLAAVRQSLLPQATLEHPHLDWTNARSTLMLFSLTGVAGPREAAPELDVLPDSIQWNPSSTGLAFYASRGAEGLRGGDFWMVNPSNPKIRVVSHTGLSLTSQRARRGPQWPERAVWVGDSIAVFGRSTPGQPGTLAFEDIKSNDVVDPRVQVIQVPAHWFLLSTNSQPRDLTPDLHDVWPCPVVAGEAAFVILGDGQAWQVDAAGPPVRLFPEFRQQLRPFSRQDFMSLARSNGGMGFVVVGGGSETLARVYFERDSPALRVFTAPRETAVLALSGSGTALLKVGAGKGAALSIMGPGRSPISLGELNPLLDQIAETKWVDFDYSNQEGAKPARLSGCLLLPTDFHRNDKYPLIVEVYPDRPGGCAAPEARQFNSMGAYPGSYSEHLLAARGFVVFRPDTGGGVSRTSEGPQAQLSKVVDRGVDAVLAAGYADPSRVGLLGFSQGGFASLWVATQSQRYQAVVSLNGWTDLVTSFFGMNWAQELVPTELPPGAHVDRYLSAAGSSFGMGGTPWQIPQRYVQNSPLWRSDAVSAPILLIHSDMDQFDDGSYKAFFASLYTQKKDARLLIYRGEGHSPSSPANIKDMWKNIFFWYDKYLGIRRDGSEKMILE